MENEEYDKRNMNVTVLIPSYNEKENLEKLIPILYAKIYPMRPDIFFSTLIVDDNSPDGTRELLAKYLRSYPHLFISSGDKSGIGNAMKRGYAFAMKKLDPDAIVTYEADFVFSPETLLTLLEGLSGVDVVLAARNNESLFYSSSQLRRVGHFVGNTMLPEWIGGMTQVHEHTAAGRAITVTNMLDRINLDALPAGYAFFPGILYALARQKAVFREIPVQFVERSSGTSKMKPAKMFHELWDSLVLAVRYRLRI